MHWLLDEDDEKATPIEVVDLVYAIRCRALPVDHAWALYLAVQHELPWVKDDARTGIHPIHTAESAHGWSRPELPTDQFYLSRRTRLILRIPKNRIGDAQRLVGKSLPLADCNMHIEQAEVRPLKPSNSLFSRGVAMLTGEDEAAFVKRMLEELHGMNISAKRVLPGRNRQVATPHGKITTCRLGIEDLKTGESLKLQEWGLGTYRHLGCGIFIPQKEMIQKKVKDSK